MTVAGAWGGGQTSRSAVCAPCAQEALVCEAPGGLRSPISHSGEWAEHISQVENIY